ncbi:diguanylate cyclase domain-containing protein [Agarivorans sp.]|uniref:diguanylate cyclase domain-containing protein n=1 Tax=Agarivorans sp. TaxID=1872412 RepID=UPI003D010505
MADALIRIYYQVAAFFSALKQYWYWLLLLMLLLAAQFVLNSYVGEFKLPTEWDWVDIVGEGLSALLVLCWLLLILSVRAKGRVTHLFALGLIMLDLALVQDFLDEFIRLPEHIQWDSLLEASPVGLLLITAAFWCWRREQHTTNLYLSKRQHIFSHPSALDKSLHIPDLAYLKHTLLKRSGNLPQWQHTALLLIEIRQFNHLLHQHGSKQADALLLMVTELLLLSLRSNDLLCHYAGARFVIVFSEVQLEQARKLAVELKQNIENFSLPVVGEAQACRLAIDSGLAMGGAASSSAVAVQTLLNQALDDLDENKQAND